MDSDAGSSVACRRRRLSRPLCFFVSLSLCFTVFLQKFLMLLGFISSSAVALSVRRCSCRLHILWVLLLICSPPPSLMTALTPDLAQIRSSHKLHWPDLKTPRRASPSSSSWAMTFFPSGKIYSDWIWCEKELHTVAPNLLLDRSVKIHNSEHHFLFNPVRNLPLEDTQTSLFLPQSLFTFSLPGICSLMLNLVDFDDQRVCLGSITTLWIQHGNVGVQNFCLNSIPGYSANLAKFISQDVVIRAISSSLLELTHWCLPVTAVCAQKPSYLVYSSVLSSSRSRTSMYSEKEGPSVETCKLGPELHSYLSGTVTDVTHNSSQSHHQPLPPTRANVIARLFLKWSLPKLEDCSPLVFCFHKRLIKFPHVQGHERSIIDDASSSSSHSVIVSFVASLLTAETLVLRNAMISARQCGINALLVCSNFQIFINLVKSRGRLLEIAVLLNDIYLLSTLFAPVEFKFIPRLVNYRVDLCG